MDKPKEPVPPGIYIDHDDNPIEVLTPQNDPVEFSPQGGGFVGRIPRAQFDKAFRLAPLPGFKLVRVSGDWMGLVQTLLAYSNGRRWNGWAMPYFTLDQAKLISRNVPGLRYDEATDAFIYRNTEDSAEPVNPADHQDEERIEPVTITVDGEVIKTYPVGAGAWCWFEVED